MQFQLAAPLPPPSTHLRWMLGSIAVMTVAALAGGSLLRQIADQQERAAARLLSVAELRLAQVEGWLTQLDMFSTVVGGSPVLPELLQRWALRGDLQSRDRLRSRLVELRRAVKGEEVLLLDAQGRTLLAEQGLDRPIGEQLARAVAQALASNQAAMTGTYRDAHPAAPSRLDLVVPLATAPSAPRAVVVLHLDPARSPLQSLREWPVPSDSGESVLWRRVGERLEVQNPLRRDPDSAGRVGVALADADLVVARAVRGELPLGRVVEGLDYSGEPVLAVVRVVAGRDWYLITKLDGSEVRSAAWRGAEWILAAAAALLLAFALSMRLWRQRADLAAARSQLAERALQANQARDRSVFSVLGEGILVCDATGRVSDCNPAAERIVGLQRAQWLGQPVVATGWRPLHADGSEMPIEALPPMRVLAGERAPPRTLIGVRTPAAALRWFELFSRPVLDPLDGRLLSVVTSFADVTQRETTLAELARHRHHLEELVAERTAELSRTAASLEDNERFIRTVTDALPGRVVYWDRELRCRFANRGYLDWLDKTPGQVLGRSVAEIADAEQLADALPRLQAALAGEAQSFERETPGADGAAAPSQVHLVHYIPDRRDDEGGSRVVGLCVMAFEITALKRAEAALALALDRSLAASRAKSEFLANMSHEIRTPMNAIIGLTHLLARDAQDARQAERLARIDEAARHLLQVINDILDLSKIESGKMELEVTEFALDEMLERCFRIVRDSADEKALELVLDSDGLPPVLRGDPTRLAQMLINLLSNAVKFTDHGWVRLRGELLAEEETRLHLRFEITDTGIGIASERQAALFEPFEQVDNSVTRRHGGTGLGLALTRRLAHRMGGEVGLSSQPGQGSRFWFDAWFLRAAGAAPLPVPVTTRLAGRRALVVDDLAESRAALTERLQMLGLAAEAVDGGGAALSRQAAALAEGRPFDVLLIDWRMAPMDGCQTLGALREQAAARGAAWPPALLVSASDGAGMVQAARAAGFASWLVKPITASAMHDALLQLFGRQSPLPLPPAAAGEAEQRLRTAHAGRRVLLAEDNRVNQEVAVLLLGAVGLVVETADDGEQALALAAERPYDLVLMDVQMPRLDGLAATRALRERLGPALPIIAMTANAFAEDRQACLAAGMNDHVTKPVDPGLLYATLLRWLPPAALALDSLAAVESLDVATALGLLGGNPQALQQALLVFVELYRQGVPGLLDAIGGDDVAAPARALHSLRGAAASVGATQLAQQVVQVERDLRSGCRVAERTAAAAELDRAVQVLAAQVDAALSPPSRRGHG